MAAAKFPPGRGAADAVVPAAADEPVYGIKGRCFLAKMCAILLERVGKIPEMLTGIFSCTKLPPTVPAEPPVLAAMVFFIAVGMRTLSALGGAVDEEGAEEEGDP